MAKNAIVMAHFWLFMILRVVPTEVESVAIQNIDEGEERGKK